MSMALLCSSLLFLLSGFQSASATFVADMDYGGIPLWINRLLGEPSVLSLQGRMDPAWFRANNPQPCPEQCDCPIQWPTALYCDQRALAHIPDSLPDRTQYLFLQGNNISTLSSSVLANVTGLRWLILDNNQLESDKLKQDSMQSQTQLWYFFANHNHLSSVPSALPAGLKQLRLAYNQISSISPEAFQNLHSLTMLLLQGNRLNTIAEGDLRGLVSLNLLDLSGNSFSTIPRHLPPSIEQLYLSNNSLTGLDEDSFEGFLNLKYLRLSHCGLQNRGVHPEVFNHSSLVELDLSFNKLTAIPTVPTTLQYLYLEANKIQEFNVTSFCREVGPQSYSKMKFLRLDGNKISYHQLPPDWVFCLRVVYFTATFPYVVIVILLIRGVTLEGAKDGIEFYIGSQSNLTKLTEAQVWKDAATQTFYSLSIGWGGLMALASYNNFHNNVFKDSFVVTLTNAGTSVLAGFAIFSILGHMAHIYKMPISKVVKEGFGLAFIAYPDALSKLPISPLWSILFFFMLFTVGLDSQFAGIEVITTCLLDAFPTVFKSKHALLTVTLCSILYLLGLPCVTRAGIYWVTLIDQFVASWVMLFLVLLEIIAISYIYGGNRFIKDIEMMIGMKTSTFWLWWRACWFFISPCIIVFILISSLVYFEPPNYGGILYPDWGMTLGWCMVAFVLMWIPVVAGYKLIKAKGNPWKRLKSMCSPSEEWHPYLDVHRGERYSEERCHRRNKSKNKPEVNLNVISSSWL